MEFFHIFDRNSKLSMGLSHGNYKTWKWPPTMENPMFFNRGSADVNWNSPMAKAVASSQPMYVLWVFVNCMSFVCLYQVCHWQNAGFSVSSHCPLTLLDLSLDHITLTDSDVRNWNAYFLRKLYSTLRLYHLEQVALTDSDVRNWNPNFLC